MRSILAVLTATAALGPPAAAQVQDPRPGAVPPPTLSRTLGPPPPAGWSLTIGAAPVLSPVWQGSRDMALSLFPDLRLNYRDTIFASIPDGVGWNAVNRNGWKAGPLAKIRFGRDEERGGSPFLLTGGSDALLGLGDVGAAGELGGFVERRSGAWRARAELRRGFGGHEGLVMDASLGRQARIGRALVTVGPRVTLASRDFIDTYFGIDTGQSQRTGLRTYAPSGGLLSFGLGGSAIRPLTRRSAVTLFTGLDQLGGEAGRSPLVRERGRRTQVTLGLGYGYRFNL
jgi:outer membrane scaffolding protein for murein synthesis (MipA/OmpV family)